MTTDKELVKLNRMRVSVIDTLDIVTKYYTSDKLNFDYWGDCFEKNENRLYDWTED